MKTFLAQDRLAALANGVALPEQLEGAGLFADISGFTPLTEKLTQSLGQRRGIEELALQINQVYETLIQDVSRFGGSVLGFAGDAIICWFDSSDQQATQRAAACSTAMRAAMEQVGDLSVKVTVCSGPAKRFVVGNPEIMLFDVLAGATIARLATAEHLAKKGEILFDEPSLKILGDMMKITAWRTAENQEQFGVAGEITFSQGLAAAEPRPELETNVMEEQLKPWLLLVIRERLNSEETGLLTELRPAVALFMRFTGIDFDRDLQAKAKLDALVQGTQGILKQYDGSLLQLTIGDKGSYLYACFGAPVAHEDDAMRAIQAALALQKLPTELAWLEPVQIGASTGIMRAGPYGSSKRRTYGVLGDETNLAARLMTTASPGEILISGRLFNQVSHLVSSEPRPPLPMKGKAEPLPVFLVTGLRKLRAIRLEEPQYNLPMMGRKDELRQIEARFEDTLQGKGQIIAITGEAGMGKSRLVAECIRLAFRKGLIGYGGACESAGTKTSYLVWQPIWQAILNLDLSLPTRRQLRNLEMEIGYLAPDRVMAIPVLSTLLGIPIEENDFTRSLEPQDRRSVLAAMLEDCLKTLARDEPLLLVLEDLHWIDAISHDLLESLARACAGYRICFLLAYRPPELLRLKEPRVENLPNFTRLSLEKLDDCDMEQIIRSKLAQFYPERSTSLPRALANQLIQRAEGNPFFIEELVNYLHDRGLNPYETDELKAVELPSSLQALILSRVDQLIETQRITLKTASVIGRLFAVDWLVGYSPVSMGPNQIRQDLLDLEKLDLTPLESPEPDLRYLFKHIITHQVAYESLTFDARKHMHELLANYLEKRYLQTNLEQQNSSLLSVLAFHYGMSENRIKQREYLRKAGDVALALFANVTALEYYTQLQDLVETDAERIELHLKKGEILELVGRWPEAEVDFSEALRTSEKIGAKEATVRSLISLGKLAISQSQYPTAMQWMVTAQARLQDLDYPGLSREVIFLIGRINSVSGDNLKAQEIFENVLLEARSAHDEQLIAEILNALGLALVYLDEYQRAKPIFEECLGHARAVGKLSTVSKALSNLGLIANALGDYQTAEEKYKEGMEWSQQLGFKRGVLVSLINLAAVSKYLHGVNASRALYKQALALSQEMDDLEAKTYILNNLGVDATEAGDLPAAKEYLSQALEISRQIGAKMTLAVSTLNLGYVSIKQNEYGTGIYYCLESLNEFDGINSQWGVIYCLIGLAASAAGLGDYPFAVQCAAQAEKRRNDIQLKLESDGQWMYDQCMVVVKDQLSLEAYQNAWNTGIEMSLDDFRELLQARK
jgi:adenylate cyclase